jgi:transcriptional regulator with XRE-family HTH domain
MIDLDSPAEIARRLHSERVRVGLTPAALAEKTQVSRATQVSYEFGNTSPTIEYLCKLREIGVDTIYVLTGQRLSDQPNLRTIFSRPDMLWMAAQHTLDLSKKQSSFPYSDAALGDTILDIYQTLAGACNKLELEKQKEENLGSVR